MGVYNRMAKTSSDTSSSSSTSTSVNYLSLSLTTNLPQTTSIIIMQSIAVFVAFLALANAANVHYVQPQQQAVVTSQRLGGNFAYTVNQGAYGYPTGYTTGYGSPVVYTTAGQVPVQTVGATQYAYTTPVVKNVNNVVPYTYGAYNTVPAVSTVVAGTPANTYKTVAGVSPVAYTSGLVGAGYPYVNNYNYGAYPYGTYGQVVY